MGPPDLCLHMYLVGSTFWRKGFNYFNIVSDHNVYILVRKKIWKDYMYLIKMATHYNQCLQFKVLGLYKTITDDLYLSLTSPGKSQCPF